MKIRTSVTSAASLIIAAGALTTPFAAAAQDGEIASAESEEEVVRPAKRTRIGLGPQLVPSYPGSDSYVLRPLIDFSRAEEGEDFAFEAPDESFGFSIFQDEGFSVGPSVNLEGKRKSEDVGGALPDVDFSVELGAFAQYAVSDNIRFRLEARQAVSGHDGFISVLAADYVWRNGDATVLSIGPRLTVTDSAYQNSYFGVAPADAAASGLPAYDASGGVQSAGGTIGVIQQFSPEWGIYAFGKYDRLIGDPADSPVVVAFGSKDQFSGGVALTYTFSGGI